MDNFNFYNDEIRNFHIRKIANLSINTQESNVDSLNLFMKFIGKETKDITENDMLNYLNNSRFTKMKNSSKNRRTTCIKRFLEHYNRNDLVKMIQYYPEQEKEINKSDLITREDLEKILKSCGNPKYKAIVMFYFETACRKDEGIHVQLKHFAYQTNKWNVYLYKSKTKPRNIPIRETIPFLKEYFNFHNFQQDDCIFNYSINSMYKLFEKIEKRTKDKFPDFKKHLHPHLFRHSRLYELASNHLINEPQMRVFAGWGTMSKMPAVYFHLDDSDIDSAINDGKMEIRNEHKTFGSIICPSCSEINNHLNSFCWKCGKIINNDIVSETINERDRIESLESEVNDLKGFIQTISQRLAKIDKIL